MEKVIPIVFATNDNFAPYTGVAIESLIIHSNSDNKYCVYVLYNEMSELHRRNIEGLSREHVSVECVNVSEQIRGVTDFKSLHLTQEAIYRLLIPKIFNQYEKIVYLDGDIIVKDDIAEFYNLDIGKCVLGVVHEVCNNAMSKYYAIHHDELRVEDAFNSGILLINADMFEREEVREKCIELLEKDVKRSEPRYAYLDQDVLNIVCKDKVCFLDDRWNFQTKYLFAGEEHNLNINYKNTYIKAAENPGIIHFAGRNKPWFIRCLSNADEFWKVAEHTVFYGEINKRAELYREQSFLQPPFCNIQKNSKIVLYGAGGKGREIWELINYEKYCEIVLWVDKNAKELSRYNSNICEIEKIKKVQFDNVIIAIESKEIAYEAKQIIAELGVCEERIEWAYREE